MEVRRLKPRRGVISFWLTLLAVAAALPAGSAPTPVVASSNVELLANVPEPGAIGGRFASIGGKRYFFATGVGGLRVYDASNPALPVPAGALALPHEENEDVDLSPNRNIALISLDRTIIGGALYVIDISIPAAPRIRSVYRYPPTPSGALGGGHIANCILDCRYAWITGSGDGWMLSLDLSNPDAPKVAGAGTGWFKPPAGRPNAVFKKGTIHDVNVDQYDPTKVWVTGSGGTDVFQVTTDLAAVNPGAPVATFDATTPSTKYLNTFIHHNSLRPKPGVVFVTEEDWLHENNSCSTSNQGRFQAYSVSGSTIAPLGQWKTSFAGGTYTNGTSPVQVTCSAHWFDWRSDDLVAIAWYNQGVRFLNTTNPSAMVQRGFFLAPGSTAFAAYFHPDVAAKDIVWVTDGTRGLDVLRFTGTAAGPPVTGPSGIPPSPASGITFAPSPVWGSACLVPRASA